MVAVILGNSSLLVSIVAALVETNLFEMVAVAAVFESNIFVREKYAEVVQDNSFAVSPDLAILKLPILPILTSKSL